MSIKLWCKVRLQGCCSDSSSFSLCMEKATAWLFRPSSYDGKETLAFFTRAADASAFCCGGSCQQGLLFSVLLLLLFCSLASVWAALGGRRVCRKVSSSLCMFLFRASMASNLYLVQGDQIACLRWWYLLVCVEANLDADALVSLIWAPVPNNIDTVWW